MIERQKWGWERVTGEYGDYVLITDKPESHGLQLGDWISVDVVDLAEFEAFVKSIREEIGDGAV